MASAQTNSPAYSYGPLMSPSIFATKWRTKHRDLIKTRYQRPLQAPPPAHPGWMFKFCHDAVEHLIYFHIQAQDHSLTQADLPPAPPRVAAPSTNVHLYSSSDLPSMMTNPFRGAQTITLIADNFVQRLRAVKEGDTVLGHKWQDFPMDWRLTMDHEVFSVVKMAETNGWWNVPEEYRREWATRMREQEGMAID